jgi:hypothetical protein
VRGSRKEMDSKNEEKTNEPSLCFFLCRWVGDEREKKIEWSQEKTERK